MGTTIEYAELIIALSAISFVLFILHAIRAAGSYRLHHDDRAAVGLVLSIGMVVVTGGILVSAVGLLIEDAQFSVAGLSIARGALIMLAAVLVLADVRAKPDPAA
jgi:hypothetical protein